MGKHPDPEHVHPEVFPSSIVRKEAGVQGWESALTQSQPDRLTVVTTGGGTVSFIENGASVSPGATAGDTAGLEALRGTNYVPGISMIKIATVYQSLDATPLTDDFELGGPSDSVNSDSGAYLDLTSGEYHAGVSTKDATLPSSQEGVLLEIEIDLEEGETRFSQSGAVEESETIGEADGGIMNLITSNSNGVGETVQLLYARQVVLF